MGSHLDNTYRVHKLIGQQRYYKNILMMHGFCPVYDVSTVVTLRRKKWIKDAKVLNESVWEVLSAPKSIREDLFRHTKRKDEKGKVTMDQQKSGRHWVNGGVNHPRMSGPIELAYKGISAEDIRAMGNWSRDDNIERYGFHHTTVRPINGGKSSKLTSKLWLEYSHYLLWGSPRISFEGNWWMSSN